MKILLAVDGSKYSLDAVDCLIEHADWYREKPAVELLTVHLPVPKLPRMHLVVGKNQIERYYREEGEAMQAGAKKKLDALQAQLKAAQDRLAALNRAAARQAAANAASRGTGTTSGGGGEPDDD